jgi:hypothetical protein
VNCRAQTLGAAERSGTHGPGFASLGLHEAAPGCSPRESGPVGAAESASPCPLQVLFVGAVDALMAAVLLRVPGLDAFQPDAQLDPPHRQPRQPGDGRRGKRGTVIGADSLRQSVFAKGGFEDGAHALRVGLLHRLAAQQITAPGIADGQRIDACSVAGLKPALEIGAPDAVASGWV